MVLIDRFYTTFDDYMVRNYIIPMNRQINKPWYIDKWCLPGGGLYLGVFYTIQ